MSTFDIGNKKKLASMSCLFELFTKASNGLLKIAKWPSKISK